MSRPFPPLRYDQVIGHRNGAKTYEMVGDYHIPFYSGNLVYKIHVFTVWFIRYMGLIYWKKIVPVSLTDAQNSCKMNENE